ncbi:MAG: hypothetical protein PHI06_05220 [Desulfobulbaceae bacterium]|nr:hypothetical protein [Desulfobulbaceae bacterium]
MKQEDQHTARARAIALPFALAALMFTMSAQATPSPILLGKKCGGCHALPPGTGEEHGPFKPGAHTQHIALSCDQCHNSGIEDDHINGIISLKPELEYQYGYAVPWPSVGSGSCGGLGHPFRPTGCHEQMPKAKCFWIPGKNCRIEEPSRH